MRFGFLHSFLSVLLCLLFLIVSIVQVCICFHLVSLPASFDASISETKYESSLVYQPFVDIELKVDCNVEYDILINGKQSPYVKYANDKKTVSLRVFNGDVVQFFSPCDDFNSAGVFVSSVGREGSSVVRYAKTIVESNLQTLYLVSL